MFLSWYNYSATWLFNWIGKICMWSFRILQKLGIGPNVIYITILCTLFIIWMFMLRKYKAEGKDKGLID